MRSSRGSPASFTRAIRSRDITGHADIAPGRKTDPGPCFDWVRYRLLIAPETRQLEPTCVGPGAALKRWPFTKPL